VTVGVAIAEAKYLWPNRTIFYAVDPALKVPERVAAAVAHWNSKTSIRFVLRGSEPDYLHIVRQPGAAQCDVGRRRGEQQLKLGDDPALGNIIHELGHAVGLWHEHCRTDRDQWVTIDPESIRDGRDGDFEIDFICGEAVTTRNLGPYDYASIQHYGAFFCAKDPDFPTIIARKDAREAPDVVRMGQRDGLSPGDIAAVDLLYAGVPAPARPAQVAARPRARPA
jgi:hypothetical protein